MKIVDARGLLCPQPLILTKKALQEISRRDKITIRTDSESSLKNLLTFLRDQGAETEVSSNGRVYDIVTTKPVKDLSRVDPEAYCENGIPVHDYVVCIRSDLMGSGDPDLGRLLMESFLSNLNLQENLPTHVVLYNSGVKLAMKQSAVCSALSELEELGTRIMLCGNCIDHFGLQFDIGVGMISNMVAITETLANAGHVLYP